MKKTKLLGSLLISIMTILPMFVLADGAFYTRMPAGTNIVNSVSIILNSSSPLNFQCGDPVIGIGFWAVGNNSFTPSYETPVQLWSSHLEFLVDVPLGDYSQVKIMCGFFGGGHGVGRSLEGGDGWGTGFVFTVTTSIPVIVVDSLSEATVGGDYSQILQANNGTIPVSWAVSGGSLPDGLTLDSSTGEIAGVPTIAGVFGFTVQVTDASGQVATKDLSILVNPAPEIVTTSLSGATAGSPYSQIIEATGGTFDLTWTVASGSLPFGLSLNGVTGGISGTPTTVGTYVFEVKVFDANAVTVSKTLAIVVNSIPVITRKNLPGGKIGKNYSQVISYSGGTGPLNWEVVSGSLPTGLGLNSVNGAISGIPTTIGRFNFTVRLTDASGAIVERGFSITIGSAKHSGLVR